MKLVYFIVFAVLVSCSTTFGQKPVAELEFVSIHADPVIGKGYKGAEDNKFGFEGGTCVKVKGSYFLFTTEVFDVPKTAATRLALWKSKDGIAFERQYTIAETNRDWNDTTHRMSPWSPMAVYDKDRNVWSVFHVGYRRKANSSNLYNMSGRIFRYDSETKGRRGVSGPYKNGEWLKIDKKPDWWEGPGEIVSFYPYKIGAEWWAFYGGNSVPNHIDASGTVNPNAKNIFYAGLAKAEGGIASKWIRQSSLNPVQINPEFIENSVVTKINDGLYINLYDGSKKGEIAYSCSKDGIHWSKEQLIKIPNPPEWISNMRTPISLISEGKGIYTIYFTAFDGKNPDKVEPLWHDGFGSLGRLQVKLINY